MSPRWSATVPDRDLPGPTLDPAWLRRLVDRDFTPTPVALDRAEIRVVAAFRAAHRTADRGSTVGSAATGSGRRVRERPRVGLAFRIAAAAALVVVVAGASATAASGPGAPLYSVRLVVERTLLPAPGQPTRVDAQLALVDRRLADAAAGLRGDDTGAAGAALEAVAGDVADIGGDASIPPAVRRDALERLDEDLALVRRLGGGLAGGEAGREALEALRVARDALSGSAVRGGRPELRRGLGRLHGRWSMQASRREAHPVASVGASFRPAAGAAVHEPRLDGQHARHGAG
jgi:hypothetical protein